MWLTRVAVDPASFPDRQRYPFSLPLLDRPLELDLASPVTFFVGENGSGKTTLLEALVRRCGVHVWGTSSHHRLHDNPQARLLWRHVDVSWSNGTMPGSFFSAETFRDWAEFMDDVALVDPGQLKYFGGASLTARSHGEGTLAYFRARYSIPGLYFLDEPEAALSPSSQIELLRVLHECGNQGQAQFLVATHSPLLLALPGARILVFGEEGVRPCSYEETEHYRLYRDFLAEPARFLENVPGGSAGGRRPQLARAPAPGGASRVPGAGE